MVTRKRFSQGLVAAALLAATVAGVVPAQAAPAKARRPAAVSTATWWQAVMALTPWAMKAGVCVDPNGGNQCSKSATTPQTLTCLTVDRGVCVDPLGQR